MAEELEAWESFVGASKGQARICRCALCLGREMRWSGWQEADVLHAAGTCPCPCPGAPASQPPSPPLPATASKCSALLPQADAAPPPPTPPGCPHAPSRPACCRVPPPLGAVPVRPIFLDTALNYVAAPDLSHRLPKKAAAEAAGTFSRLFGGWR